MRLTMQRFIIGALHDLVTDTAVIMLLVWGVYSGRDIVVAGSVVALALLHRRTHNLKSEAER